MLNQIFLKEMEDKNWQEVSGQIRNFIRETVKKFNKDGVIIGLSGGIDSAVVAYLTSQALKDKQVLFLIMPDRDSNKENIKNAQEIAKILKREYKKIDLTPILKEIGIYRLIPKFFLNERIVKKLFNHLKNKIKSQMLHSKGILGFTTFDFASRRATAYALPKLRLRSLLLYYFGVLKNLLVCGTTNKTEYLIGHYDKYGDGACDIEPIRYLYKTQVKKLAHFLNVPEKIIKKSPSPDLFAGSIMTDESWMGMTFEQLDSILYGLEKKIEKNKLAEILNIDVKTIEEVEKAKQNEMLKRKMPLSLEI